MSASVSHEQLAMYMTGPEIKAKIGDKAQDRLHIGTGFNDGYSVRESTESMWDRKLKESRTRGLHTRIKKQGIKKAVRLMPYQGGNILLDGYHRVASGDAHGMLIPVEHI